MEYIDERTFYQLFLTVGALFGFAVSAAGMLYARLVMRNGWAETAPEAVLVRAMLKLATLYTFLLVYFAVYFIVRMSSSTSSGLEGAVYVAALGGYALAIFALALPGVVAALVANVLRERGESIEEVVLDTRAKVEDVQANVHNIEGVDGKEVSEGNSDNE